MKRIAYLITLLVLLLSSCRTSKVESTTEVHDTLYQTSVRIDTQYINKITKDTVYMRNTKADTLILRDSIYEREYIKGDTVVIYKYVEKGSNKSNIKIDTVYRDRLRVDTINTSTIAHDTIYVSNNDTTATTITKKATFFQRFKAWLIGIAIGAIVAVMAYLGYKHNVFHVISGE